MPVKIPMLFLLAGLCAYFVYGLVVYGPVRDTRAALPLGLLCALAANAIWLSLCRYLGDKGHIFFYAFAWDLVVIAATILVPTCVFGQRCSPVGWLGVALCVAGVCCVKLGLGE